MRTPADNLGEKGQGFPKGTLVTTTDTFDKARYSDVPGEVWSFTGWDRASDTITGADVRAASPAGAHAGSNTYATSWALAAPRAYG